MPQIYDDKKKADTLKLDRNKAADEASKKKDLVKAGTPVEQQEKALEPQKAPPEVKARKTPDPKEKSAKEEATKKSPKAPEETVKKAAEAAEKKTDFWPAIYDLQHAAAAAEAGKIKTEGDIDKQIAAGTALAKSLEEANETFTHKCEVRDAIAKLEGAKEALKAPPPPEDAVKEVVAKAEQKEMPAAVAAAVAVKATSLIGGANKTQADKLSEAADKAGKKSGGMAS